MNNENKRTSTIESATDSMNYERVNPTYNNMKSLIFLCMLVFKRMIVSLQAVCWLAIVTTSVSLLPISCRFQAVRKTFLSELRELKLRDQTPYTAQSIISLLMGLKFFRVKVSIELLNSLGCEGVKVWVFKKF